MCGIMGYIGKPYKYTGSVIEKLAILNQSRGKDSTGLIVASSKNIDLSKLAVNASIFVKQKRTMEMLRNIHQCGNYATIIGHTRAATQGAVTDQNAHPYQIGKYLFAHNGVIYNFSELQRKYKTDYQVDSQIIGYLLNTYDYRKVFEKKLEGWFAVPYFEMENPSTLKIAKHTSPLAVAYLPNKQGVFFSSEYNHLLEATKHIKGINVSKCDGDKLYTFKWNGQYLENSKEKLNIKQKSYYTYSGDYEEYQTYYDYRPSVTYANSKGAYGYWDAKGYYHTYKTHKNTKRVKSNNAGFTDMSDNLNDYWERLAKLKMAELEQKSNEAEYINSETDAINAQCEIDIDEYYAEQADKLADAEIQLIEASINESENQPVTSNYCSCDCGCNVKIDSYKTIKCMDCIYNWQVCESIIKTRSKNKAL